MAPLQNAPYALHMGRASALLVALCASLVAVVSCGGRIESSGGAGGGGPAPSSSSSSSANEPDAGAAGPGLTCGDPIHVSIGGTIHGSTCGGTSLTPDEDPCDYDSPVVYFYVEAPPGAAFSIDSPVSLIVSGYDTCAELVSPNCGGTPFGPTQANLRLFTVRFGPIATGPNGDGGPCGDFTITVAGQ